MQNTVPTAAVLVMLAGGALAGTAAAQTGSPIPPPTVAERDEAATTVAEAVAREARRTHAATLLKERELEVEVSPVLAGRYTVRVKRVGAGPTVLSGGDTPDRGSFSDFEDDVALSSSGRTYLKGLRTRSSSRLTFQVSVTFTAKAGGASRTVTERYRQRIKG